MHWRADHAWRRARHGGSCHRRGGHRRGRCAAGHRSNGSGLRHDSQLGLEALDLKLLIEVGELVEEDLLFLRLRGRPKQVLLILRLDLLKARGALQGLRIELLPP